MNSVTHIFDASNVYGSSLAEVNDLRLTGTGKLDSQIVNGVELPPPNRADCENRPADRCPFKGGDTRINTTRKLLKLIGWLCWRLCHRYRHALTYLIYSHYSRV